MPIRGAGDTLEAYRTTTVPICPAVELGQLVIVELEPRRQAALGVDRVEGRVEAITPFTHTLQVGAHFVGGHRSTDVVHPTAPVLERP